MRGTPDPQSARLTTLSPEDLIQADHPVRQIRVVVDEVERVRAGVPGASRPPAGRARHVTGAEVSAVTRTPGGLVVRAFRTGPEAGPVLVEHEGAPASGWIIDLAGRPVAPFEGAVELRARQICTLVLS